MIYMLAFSFNHTMQGGKNILPFQKKKGKASAPEFQPHKGNPTRSRRRKGRHRQLRSLLFSLLFVIQKQQEALTLVNSSVGPAFPAKGKRCQRVSRGRQNARCLRWRQNARARVRVFHDGMTPLIADTKVFCFRYSQCLAYASCFILVQKCLTSMHFTHKSGLKLQSLFDFF